MDDNNRIEKIEKQAERDVKRLTDLYAEISEIVTRMHLLGMELGSIHTFLKLTEAEEKGEE